jgi:hypothetical protein
VDRQAIAREQRRRQALEALQFERARADALREQLETIVSELEGPALDESIFAKLTAEEVEIVRAALYEPELPRAEEEDWLSRDPEPFEADPAEQESEIARLEQEIAESKKRQEAFERYLEAL